MKKRKIQGETRRNAAKHVNSTELIQRGGKEKGDCSWLISHIRVRVNYSKEVIQGVKTVLILYGKHKGVFGNLVERDTEKETGVVRDADTHELLNVHLEQIAEYIGDPSHLGH
ncbi:hypothetical protein MKX03_000123 [Papaver bracteatum]|nr:hypothetical protein MKX03_000123 [Papaver bracteatum]